ncbi:11152_t:CDS:2, partial [Funneliformis geosporum]
MTYSFKHQLEDQHKLQANNMEKQCKFHIFTLDKTMIEKDREIDFASAKKTIKVLDDIIYSKDQTIIAYNEGLQRINPGCIDDTIELSSFYEKDSQNLWSR